MRLRDIGTLGFTWRDLKIIVKHTKGPDSALAIAVNPDRIWDGLDTNLLASLVDIGRQLLWSKSKDAQHNRNRPKPIPRPGVKGEAKRTRGQALSAAEMRARLAKPRVAQQQ